MRTWVEIDKENLKYNVLKLKEIANNREVLGVVKANAYGLGSIEIAKILKEVGVKFFLSISTQVLIFPPNKLKSKNTPMSKHQVYLLYIYIFYFAALPRFFEASSTNFLKTLSASVVTSFLSTASKV